jgi:hypothetical protein
MIIMIIMIMIMIMIMIIITTIIIIISRHRAPRKGPSKCLHWHSKSVWGSVCPSWQGGGLRSDGAV